MNDEHAHNEHYCHLMDDNVKLRTTKRYIYNKNNKEPLQSFEVECMDICEKCFELDCKYAVGSIGIKPF
jgi:hypothetical protein